MKNRINKFTASAACLLFCAIAAAPSLAQDGSPNLFRLQSLPADMRTISTSGNSECLVVPNKITVVLGVKSFDKSLNTSCAATDQAVKRILALSAKYKIQKSDVQTADITITPVYPEAHSDYGSSYGSTPVSKAVGYSCQQDIGFILRKGEKPGALITDAITAGANFVQSISRDTTELRKYRDQTRLQALRAAKEKAEALANELGMKVGKPLHIQEGSSSSTIATYMQTAQNSSLSAASPEKSDSDEGFALGRISVSSTVSVTWQLID